MEFKRENKKKKKKKKIEQFYFANILNLPDELQFLSKKNIHPT